MVMQTIWLEIYITLLKKFSVTSSKSIEVILPVGCIDTRVLYGLPGMNHLAVANINAYMGYGA